MQPYFFRHIYMSEKITVKAILIFFFILHVVCPFTSKICDLSEVILLTHIITLWHILCTYMNAATLHLLEAIK